jgi:hypothetical protein
MLRTVALFLLLVPAVASAQDGMPDYRAWRLACAKLPANRELRGDLPDRKVLPLPAFADFEKALDAFLQAERQGTLADGKVWLGKQPDAKTFFDFSRSWWGDDGVPFQPFAAKLVLPNDAVAIVMGDLHGDIRSLMRTLDELNDRKILDGFRFRDAKHHLLFLGDFTDRGAYGTEVLYTLYRLKLANPNQVHFARGNHEDFHLAARYGFLAELRSKYGQQANITKVIRSYDLLPVVWYVGNGADFLQMNHGGMEPGYDPRPLLAAPGSLRYQLLGELKQKTYHAARTGWLGKSPAVLAEAEEHFRDFTPEYPTRPRTIGFMWNDFTVFADEQALGFDRSIVFGKAPTRRILEDASTDRVRVRAVMRAHQHSAAPNPLMKRLVASDGLYRHWQENESTADADKNIDAIRQHLRPGDSRPIPDGSVWTFNVSPDSIYGEVCRYDFATIGIITFAADFKDWRVQVVRIPVL